MKIYQLVWKYECDPALASAFEEAYGRQGAWFRLFETSDDFLGQEFMKDVSTGAYMLIDRWLSKEIYEAFLDDHQAEYETLSAQYNGLYRSEELIGAFETVE